MADRLKEGIQDLANCLAETLTPGCSVAGQGELSVFSGREGRSRKRFCGDTKDLRLGQAPNNTSPLH